MRDGIKHVAFNCKTGEEALELLNTEEKFLAETGDSIARCMLELQALNGDYFGDYAFWAEQLKQHLDTFLMRRRDYTDMQEFFIATMPLSLQKARAAKAGV